MRKRIAVVTDALSSEQIFRHFYKYYGRHFGVENLFVITYLGLGMQFKAYDLGGLVELPVGYEDETRKLVITQFVAALLHCYDLIIHVDVDEFLLVDPGVSSSLSEFLDANDFPYITARGFDVIQLGGEQPLPDKSHEPILKRRSYAYPNSALNKTCVVSSPVEWSAGFHSASVFPEFGPLFMLHMKRVDVNWQLNWFLKMYSAIENNPKVAAIIKDYYTPDEAKIREYHREVENRPRLNGISQWYRDDFTKEFLAGIAFSPPDRLYAGNFAHELVLCQIPDEWKTMI